MDSLLHNDQEEQEDIENSPGKPWPFSSTPFWRCVYGLH